MDTFLAKAAKQLNGNSSTAGLIEKGLGDDTAPYSIEANNWYKSLPYGFSFFSRDEKAGDKAKSTVWLPIAPENVSIKTYFATNLVTTLYGVVEEHSEVRYYDITISGTTGYVPRFTAPFEKGAAVSDVQSAGRDSFKDDSLLGSLSNTVGGFLPEVTNTISQVNDTIQGFNEAVNGKQNPTGVVPTKSGYYAFHKLYQFFLKYKRDTAGQPPGQKGKSLTDALAGAVSLPSTGTAKRRNVHPIQFLNYKDNTKYDCVPMDFTLTRSANSPMLYNYSIKLRAYNLRDVSASNVKNSSDLLTNNLSKLGLDGLEGQSAFASLSAVAGDAATLVSTII